jgi:DNA polymerase-3 subunit delta'
MGLRDVRGQDRALRALGQALAQGRFHHAYRFEGPEGVGKEMTAMALARVLNCTDPGELTLEDEADVTLPADCGRCKQCRMIEAGGHPDVRVVAPPADRTVINIASIRELHGWVAYPPSEGRAKVVVVRDADRITEEAANAFLKMLEEPPSRTHFFLVTSRPHNLLNTVSSRSVPVRFAPLAPEDLDAVLRSLVTDERERARIDDVARLSGGSVSSALSQLSEQWGETLETVVSLDAAYAGSVADVVTLLEDVPMGRAHVETLLTFLEMFYRDVAYVGVTGDAEGLLLRPLEDAIRERARSLPPERASAMALAVPAHRSLLAGYVNPRMVLERLYMELESAAV